VKEPKNLCRNCNQDFYRLSMFDSHRSEFKVVGSAQILQGDCIEPQLLGYVARGGIWYDPEGLETYEKLAKARAARK